MSHGKSWRATPRSPAEGTWQTVARHGVRCRGPKPSKLNVRLDADRLVRWTLNNFDTYWRQLLNRAARFPHPQTLIALTSWGAGWIVLGVSRLHYTLATGEICSKEAASSTKACAFDGETGLAQMQPVRCRSSRPTCESVPSVMARCIGRRSTADAMLSPLARWSSPTLTNGSTILNHDKRRVRQGVWQRDSCCLSHLQNSSDFV